MENNSGRLLKSCRRSSRFDKITQHVLNFQEKTKLLTNVSLTFNKKQALNCSNDDQDVLELLCNCNAFRSGQKKIQTVNRKVLLPKSNDHNFMQLANKWYESSLKGRTKSGKCKICTFYLMFKNTVLEYSRPRFTAWKVPKYEVLLVQIQKNMDQKKIWFLDTFQWFLLISKMLDYCKTFPLLFMIVVFIC